MPVQKNTAAQTALPPRIRELRKKIQDESYLSGAIDRIAVIVSRQVVEGRSVTGHTAEFIAR